jgi:hypothetical protein
MQNDVDKKQLRSFGLIVGGVFALIGVWPAVIRGMDPRWWALVLAVILILPALIYPKILYWPNKGWMLVGHVLGWINTRIILGAVFYVVITPVGLIRGWLGKDPMGKCLKPGVTSYRVPRAPRPPSHLTKQY